MQWGLLTPKSPCLWIWGLSQALLNCGLNVSPVNLKDFCSEVLFKAVLLFTFSIERNRNVVSQLIRPAPVALTFGGWGIGGETSGYTADMTSSSKGEERRYSILKDFFLRGGWKQKSLCSYAANPTPVGERKKEREGLWKLFGSFAHRFNNFWISFCLRREKQSLDVLTHRAMFPSVVLRGSHWLRLFLASVELVAEQLEKRSTHLVQRLKTFFSCYKNSVSKWVLQWFSLAFNNQMRSRYSPISHLNKHILNSQTGFHLEWGHSVRSLVHSF